MNHNLSNPLVSLVIPAYNRAEMIGETLQSIAAQTYTNWECIVVDDGSEDDTIERVKTYVNIDQRFKLFERPAHHKAGGSGARNFGIDKADGKYLVFIDSDDLLDPNCLLNRVQNFESAPQFDFLVFRTRYFFEKIGDCEHAVGKDPEKITDFLSEFLKYSLPWDTRGPIWKKSTLEKLNYFDEQLDRLQDVDLHTRALKSGMKFRYYDIADTYYRGNSAEVKLDPSYFALKVLPSFYSYYQKVFNDLEMLYLPDLQQGIMVTFKKYFLAQAKRNAKSIHRYITDISNSGMISKKQKNVLRYMTLCYSNNLDKIIGNRNLIRLANKVYYNS
ncbi:MAG: hypothetical protein C0591_14090 [Marinilabiliales bacterium]|nr:MAG: hypothetical protein C0591_14090 [Marinilabiliales bacterium]